MGQKIYKPRVIIRGVARGGAEGALAPRNLADQLTLFKPGGGADYTPHTTASPSGFKKLSTPLEKVCVAAKDGGVHSRASFISRFIFIVD